MSEHDVRIDRVDASVQLLLDEEYSLLLVLRQERLALVCRRLFLVVFAGSRLGFAPGSGAVAVVLTTVF